MADEAFGTETGKEFAKIFLAKVNNPYGEATFSEIKYNASKTVREMFKHYESQTSLYDSTQKVSAGSQLATIGSGDYKTVNNVDAKKVEDDSEKRIQNRIDSDPVGRLVLASEEAMPTAPTTLQIIEKENRNRQPMIQLEDSNTVYLFNNEEDAKKDPNYQLVANQFLYQKVNDLEMEYTFQTDARNQKGKAYNLKFTLTNLSAV
jgi:hypothetical protein